MPSAAALLPLRHGRCVTGLVVANRNSTAGGPVSAPKCSFNCEAISGRSQNCLQELYLFAKGDDQLIWRVNCCGRGLAGFFAS